MQTIVGVVRGGPSREHEVSLKTGAAILAALPEERFLTRDIYIDREGAWHDRGKLVSPERALRQLDVALIALHGEFGEDGGVQRVLERYGIPYAGATAFGSHLAMHKLMAKMRAQEAGLAVPAFHYFDRAEAIEEGAQEVIRTFQQPVVVKPVGGGSSIGVSIVGGYAPVVAAVAQLFADGAPAVLVEEYIRGQEASVGIVENLRGEAFYALPAIEIVPAFAEATAGRPSFFSYEAKYSGETRENCPGNFSRVTKEELARAARLMHRALELRHYSRSDFIVAPSGIYYLETNSLPGLTSESLMNKSLMAVGIPLADFLSHLVNLALRR